MLFRSLFELARRHCALFAAASCLQLWLRSRALLPAFFASGEGLALCLDRLLAPLGPSRAPKRHRLLQRAAEELRALHEQDRLFSITPIQLAARGR